MAIDITFFAVLLGAVTFCAWFLGGYISSVADGSLKFLGRLEGFLLKLFGADRREMDWKEYAKSFIAFLLLGICLLFALQMLQGALPLNPQGFGAVRWDSALNTSVSFATNTNWQALSGESSMSHLTQMAGLTVQNFLSAGAGLAVAFALMRAFSRKSASTIGNFWVDLNRGIIYILLPLSVLFSVVFAGLGVVQTLQGSVAVTPVSGGTLNLPLGPVASQLAIKLIGSNGGGFFGTNSAHPFENPSTLSNALSIFAILLVPASMPFAFGRLSGDKRKGIAIFAAMMILFVVGLGLAYTSEMNSTGIAGLPGNAVMYGKEVRFGVAGSTLWAQATTATSNGGVNAVHDMMTPGANLVQIFNIVTGEVIFGGIGVGMVGMLLYAVLTMFIAGLMIGRTPELLGKKLEAGEMWMAVIALMGPAVAVLGMTAASIAFKANAGSVNPDGPRALTEMLYANASFVGNNGSSLGGLPSNTLFMNISGSLGMLLGRLGTVIPAVALAGSLARKKISPPSVATIDTASPVFIAMLVVIIVVVGALTFFPSFLLGPVLEAIRLGMRGL